MLARIPMTPVVLLVSFIVLIATVLGLFGAPMAGTAGAIAATVGAGILTLPMALAFSHGSHGEAGH